MVGWGNFPGSPVNASQMTISLPSGEIDGATVLFGELFSHFGTRIIRLPDLRRFGGSIAHIRPTITSWPIFTGPIDALMSIDDETSTWINCPMGNVWGAFWLSMDVLRISRLGASNWGSRLNGPSKRLLPEEQRFSFQRYPAEVVRISADATLDRADGISWGIRNISPLTHRRWPDLRQPRDRAT